MLYTPVGSPAMEKRQEKEERTGEGEGRTGVNRRIRIDRVLSDRHREPTWSELNVARKVIKAK